MRTFWLITSSPHIIGSLTPSGMGAPLHPSLRFMSPEEARVFTRREALAPIVRPGLEGGMREARFESSEEQKRW
jgi:hypothetical protein